MRRDECGEQVLVDGYNQKHLPDVFWRYLVLTGAVVECGKRVGEKRYRLSEE